MTHIRDLHGLHPFGGFDVPALIDLQAGVRGEHPFLIWEPFEGAAETWSYKRFATETKRLAAGLAAKGLRAADRLLIHLDNCPEAVLAWYACARLGAVAVTTNTGSAQDELDYFAQHSRAVAAITQPAYAERVAEAMPAARFLALTATDCGTPPARAHRPEAAARFDALYADEAGAPARAADPEWPVGIQYTSGTTSRPKAVVWTHANALWGAKMCARNEDLLPTDVHLTYLPFFHTNAQSYSVLACLWAGATLVLQPKFSASRFWPVSLKHGCTWTSTIPFCVKALMAHEVPAGHSYRLWGTGICDAPWDAHFRVKTMGWWGMTETITHGIVSDPRLPGHAMTIGRPAAEYRIAIRTEGGAPARAGEEGRLWIGGVRGLSLFLEYADNEKAMAESFDENGFFDTGDRVLAHADGYIQFQDRDKDMLKVGAENVAASEVERVISSVPGVSEVAVVGKADPMLDQIPVAFVLPFGGIASAPPGLAAAIEAACARQLAPFKRPREVRLVDELPRSTLEKIAKNKLRDMLKAEAASR